MENCIDWNAMSKVWEAYEMMGISPLNLDNLLEHVESPVCIVGAGSGLNVEFLKSRNYQVIGYDNSRPMIDLALKDRSLTVEFASADSLPDEDNKYKTVILATGIFNRITLYKDFAEEVIFEAKRVLQKKGKVILGYFTENMSLNYVFDRLKLTQVPSNNRFFGGQSSLELVKQRFLNESDICKRTIDYIFVNYTSILLDQLELVNNVENKFEATEKYDSFISNNMGFEYYDLNSIDESFLKSMFESGFSTIGNKKLTPGDVSVLIGENFG